MKKLFCFTLFLPLILTISSANSSAQQSGNIKLGAGILYDTDVATAGIQANATFRVIERIAIAPKVNIYFPGGDDATDAVQNLWSANLDGHLILSVGKFHHIYGLGGLNASFVKLEGSENSGTDYALNTGFGGEYHLSNFSIFSEIKYLIKSNRSAVFGLGARLPLN